MDKKTEVRRIFDSISKKYDFLNHLLSAGIDNYWRKKALKLSKISPESVILDIACGTGDFSIAAKKLNPAKIYGADLSANMLKIFNDKKNWSRGNIVQTISENLPFKPGSFTNITVAFGVRNFYDLPQAFNSIRSSLKPGGRFTILEFQLPGNFFIRKIYLLYFTKILPFIGGIVSRDRAAYNYLPESVEKFDKEVNLPDLLANAGFKNISKNTLTFGIVQIVIGRN